MTAAVAAGKETIVAPVVSLSVTERVARGQLVVFVIVRTTYPALTVALTRMDPPGVEKWVRGGSTTGKPGAGAVAKTGGAGNPVIEPVETCVVCSIWLKLKLN